MKTRNIPVDSYETADAFLGKKSNRPLCNNTHILRAADCIAVILHDTAIVKYFPNGTIELNSGGWKTVTTKTRMNACLPTTLLVSQVNFDWIVSTLRSGEWYDMPYRDGILLLV